MFERTADFFFFVLRVATVAVIVSSALILIWDELIRPLWKKFMGPPPPKICPGDRVEATRDFQTTDRDINRNIEGIVIEVSDGKLRVKADEENTYDCFLAGAVLLEAGSKFVTKIIATQTLNGRWEVRKLGHMFPVGDGSSLEQALQDLDDKLPVPCTGSCEIIKQYDPLA